MSNFPLPGSDDKNLGRILPGDAWVNICRSSFLTCKCIFQKPEQHKYEIFPQPQWDIQLWEKILRIIWREIKPCIVRIGVSTPHSSKNTTSVLLVKLPSPPLTLNLETIQSSPLYIGFSWHPPKTQIFPWRPKVLQFFILHPHLSFKSN